jgi:hypothetical protein
VNLFVAARAVFDALRHDEQLFRPASFIGLSRSSALAKGASCVIIAAAALTR